MTQQSPEKENTNIPPPLFLHQLAWHYQISVDTMRAELAEIESELKKLAGVRPRYKYSSKQVAFIISHLGEFPRKDPAPKYREGKITKKQ